MRRAERIIDIDVGQPRQGAREAVVVGFLFRMEAQVFEQHGLPGCQRVRPCRSTVVADAVGRQLHFLPEQLRQALGDRRQAELRLRLALRTTKVRREDDARAVLAGVAQGR